MKSLNLSLGKTPFRLTVSVVQAGRDLQIYLGGGEQYHIGSVVISQPRPSLKNPERISCTTSVFNIMGHKDDKPAILFAESFCKKFNCITVVSAGIHIDNATEKDLEKIMK